MKRLIIVILVFLPFFHLNGQMYTRSNLTMGISTGINVTRLVQGTTLFNRAVLPELGVDFFSRLVPRLHINYGAQFSMKGTNDYNSLGDLRAYFIEPHVALQFEPLDFARVEGGIQYSQLITAQTVKLSGDSSSGKERTPITGFGSPLEFFGGVQVNLGGQISAGCRYYIPHKNTEFRRIEIRINIIMVQGYIKRRPK